MSGWAKMATDLDWNPKIRAAGPDAREVFLFVLRVNDRIRGDGVIPARYIAPRHLAEVLMRDETACNAAVVSCCAHDLLSVSGDEVAIIGWDDEWRPPASSTQRVRAFRERKRRETVTSVSGNGETPKTRLDQTRLDPEIPGSAPAPSRPTPEQAKRTRAKPPPKQSAAADAKRIAERAVAKFNQYFNRQVGAAGYERAVKRLLAEGYTEMEIIGVVWWASEEWGADPDWRMKVDPGTLFKLQSAHGSRTFPQYLALADERWAETESKPCPWRAPPPTRPAPKQQQLVTAGGAP